MTGDTARTGSIAGASGDAGVEYRRAVAAYAVACGLSGVPLEGVEIAPSNAIVNYVALEADQPVDDIVVGFDSHRALIQAKRRLDGGKPFRESVEQWVRAAKEGLDPKKDRLVIAAGSMSGPMRQLRTVLNRNRTAYPGAPTQAEQDQLDRLNSLLSELTASQRELVRTCAVIWEIAVEDLDDPSTQAAIGHLRHIVEDGSPETARAAWLALSAAAGKTARLRGGHNLPGWLEEIRRAGVELTTLGSSAAAKLERTDRAIDRYKKRLIRAGATLDLRGMGAALPGLRFDSADSKVLVGVDPSDDREQAELLWAFLRRGRVILTGLPGGGKSTALRRLAGQLASDPSMPLPLLASLRDLQSLARPDISLRDQIISLAIKDGDGPDRPLLAAEIERRLSGDGPIAILLDALDETYDQRGAVVAAVDEMARNLPDGVSFLLATRDVAYAHAATLGWAELRLQPPKDAATTVRAVLEAAAASKNVDSAQVDGWVTERTKWVSTVVAQETTLGETPLFPVLLALLAGERGVSNLPRLRADVLQAVIRDVIVKREAMRISNQPIGTLEGSAKAEALVQAFWIQGATIVESGGSATVGIVRRAVSAAIAERWNMAIGHAEAAAHDTTRLFDESGVFVLSGQDEVVIPRIALFAEIGDATLIATRPQHVSAWVGSRIAAGQFESLVLAASLSPEVAAAAQEALMLPNASVELAEALKRARQEGLGLEDWSVRRIADLLIARATDGTRDGWRSWRDVLDLPAPEEARGVAINAAAQLGDDYGKLAKATMLLRFPPPTWSDADLKSLRDVLEIESLTTLAEASSSARYSLGDALSDGGLAAAQISSAAILLDRDPTAVDLVVERARTARTRALNPLLQLLRDHGHSEEAATIEKRLADRFSGLHLPEFLTEAEESDYLVVLRLLAEAPPSAPSASEATRLDELATFAETLDLNYSGLHFYRMDQSELREILDLVTQLYGFDPALLSAEASLLLARLENWSDHDPFYALFDGAKRASKTYWHEISDIDRAAEVILRLFVLAPGQARLGMISMWGAPASPAIEDRLRRLITALESSPQHEWFAAAALASLPSTPEPRTWRQSEDPVRRRVAAALLDPATPEYRAFLDDPDGHVQDEAIRRFVRSSAPDIPSVLRGISERPNPDWMCLRCRTVNPGISPLGCIKVDCRRGGPDPSAAAKRALLEGHIQS